MAVEVTVIKSTAIDPSFFQQVAGGMPEWFQQGGIVMWLLLLTSFLVTIITLERSFLWIRYHLKNEHFLINDCFASLNKNEKEQALIFSQTLDTPALNMLKHGINSLPFSPQHKMKFYIQYQVNVMSQGQSLLSTAIFIALLLGLLGTVLCLIDSLNAQSLQNNESINYLFSEVSNSLFPIAFGLCVALFALIPYKTFQIQAKKLNHHLQYICNEFNYICQQKSLVTNKKSEIMELQGRRITDSLHRKETVQEQNEMPYHYEFKEGSDEVNVSLHKEMKDLHKTSQSSLLDMYKAELNTSTKKRKTDENTPSSLFDMHEDLVDEEKELYGVDEVKLQEKQEETQHFEKAENL